MICVTNILCLRWSWQSLKVTTCSPPQNSKHSDGQQQACHCDLITVFWTSVSVKREAIFEENENERSQVSSPERVQCTVDFVYVNGELPENQLSRSMKKYHLKEEFKKKIHAKVNGLQNSVVGRGKLATIYIKIIKRLMISEYNHMIEMTWGQINDYSDDNILV